MRVPAARLLLAVIVVPLCPAAELELRYTFIERIVAEQFFTQEGRLYVRGNKTNRCQFAFLEAPHIGAENGRLRVAARFSGRQALNLGMCVGLGDSFDLTMTAVPFVRSGAVAFKDVQVTTTKNSYYVRRVRTALMSSMGKDFKIEVEDQAKKLFEQMRGQSPYPVSFGGFNLSDIRVTAEGLVLVVDFRVVVK